MAHVPALPVPPLASEAGGGMSDPRVGYGARLYDDDDDYRGRCV